MNFKNVFNWDNSRSFFKKAVSNNVKVVSVHVLVMDIVVFKNVCFILTRLFNVYTVVVNLVVILTALHVHKPVKNIVICLKCLNLN